MKRSKTTGERADILIAGGGPTGATLAIALAQVGLQVVVVEKQTRQAQLENTFDIRGYALARSTEKLFQALGLAEDLSLAGTPINEIRIHNGKDPTFLDFIVKEHQTGLPLPMGNVIEAYKLRQSLVKVADNYDNIVWVDGTEVETFEVKPGHVSVALSSGQEFNVSLLVGAEGKNSPVREKAGFEVTAWQYNQDALVCNLKHKNIHRGIAYERFLRTGPLATLPLKGKYSSLVWTAEPDEIALCKEMPAEEFNAILQEKIGDELEDVTVDSEPISFPLGVQLCTNLVKSRIALIADAAHVIHPLAGQGLNLGFRDVAVLAEVVFNAYRLGLDIGDSGILKKYEQWRRVDILSLLAVTDGLNRLFSRQSETLHLVRRFGLRAFKKIPFLRELASYHAMGVLGDLPRLCQGKPLLGAPVL